MSRYSDHFTLTADRLAVLVRVARGERPEIQRNRLRWYVQQGWMVRGAGKIPTHTLTDKAWTAIEAETGMKRRAFVLAHSSGTGYVSDGKPLHTRAAHRERS